MTDYQKYINALRKCAREHENDRTFTGYIIVSDLCRDTANLLEALEQEPNTWSLDDAREDFTYDVYNTLDFLPTNNEANRIIDSFDRVTSGIKKDPILDKIRAEIEEISGEITPLVNVYKVLDIIDKYKEESEGNE